jgi:hypothetical protein
MICAPKPNPTVLQLIAFLLALKRYEINTKTNIPKSPLKRLLTVKPWLDTISEVDSCATMD